MVFFNCANLCTTDPSYTTEEHVFLITPKDSLGIPLSSLDQLPPAGAFEVLIKGPGASLAEGQAPKITPVVSSAGGTPVATGQYEVTYRRTETRWYVLTVKACDWNFDGAACAGAKRLVQAPDGSAWGAGAPVAIRPGTSLAVKSSAELVSDATVVAGGAVKVKLQARDAYDNKASYDDTYPTDGWQLTATLLEGGPSVAVEAELDIVYGEGGKAEGHYDGTLKLTKAGTYEVSAKLKQQDGAVGVVKFDGSTNALTGTVQVTVLPGNLEAASAAASSDIVRGGGVGEVLDFTVTPMDAYGNPVAVTADVSCEVTLNRTVGPAEIGPVAAELLVDGAEGEVAGTTCSRNAACGAAATAADCQFEVRYRVRVAGTYSVDVKLAGEGIKDNPRSGVTFRAGEVDAAACTMLDQGSLADGTGARAGVPNEFTVQARDRFGNAVVDADSLVFQVYSLLLGRVGGGVSLTLAIDES